MLDLQNLTLILVYFSPSPRFFLFFFNDTATTEIYTLSLHDALPISNSTNHNYLVSTSAVSATDVWAVGNTSNVGVRSEEHTSELQSHLNLVCRLLLEKKKTRYSNAPSKTPIDISSALPATRTGRPPR